MRRIETTNSSRWLKQSKTTTRWHKREAKLIISQKNREPKLRKRLRMERWAISNVARLCSSQHPDRSIIWNGPNDQVNLRCCRIKETCIPEFSETPDYEDDQRPDSFLNHAFSNSEQPPFETLPGDAHFRGHLVCRNSPYLGNIDIHPLDVWLAGFAESGLAGCGCC